MAILVCLALATATSASGAVISVGGAEVGEAGVGRAYAEALQYQRMTESALCPT